jgi:hypothetical protein
MSWWQRLWRRRRLEKELDKELRFHVDEHATDLTGRGLDPASALRTAKISLGGTEQVKEQCRDTRGTRRVEDLGRDVVYAVPNPATAPRLHRRRSSHAGAGHRGNDRHVHRDQRRSAQAVRLTRTGPSGSSARTNRLEYAPGEYMGVHGSELSRLQTRSSGSGYDCMVDPSRHGERTGAAEYVDGLEIDSNMFSLLA